MFNVCSCCGRRCLRWGGWLISVIIPNQSCVPARVTAAAATISLFMYSLSFFYQFLMWRWEAQPWWLYTCLLVSLGLAGRLDPGKQADVGIVIMAVFLIIIIILMFVRPCIPSYRSNLICISWYSSMLVYKLVYYNTCVRQMICICSCCG